tara:strand:+ start:799 stop:1062 length:264 start_codon:yes stop_codon:yes gene_type:complete
MIQYKLKKLIKGYRVSPLLKNRTLVGIPYKHEFKDIKVQHKEDKMIITKNTPLLHREQFKDKFNRNTFYTLYYYEWNPNKVQMELFR